MNVPIRISQLSHISPVLSGDQLLISRGAGATGESGRVFAKHLVCDMLSATNTSTLNLSFDKALGTFKGEVVGVPSNIGGTGIKTYLPGQILIGTSTGSITANFLTAGPRMEITNSSGTITLTPSATNLSIAYFLSSVNIVPTTGSLATLNAATNTAAGLMSNADRIKLDGIEVNANKYIHPGYSWTKTSLNGTTVIDNLSVDSLGHLTDWSTRTLGTMSIQNANSVNITGGTVEATNDIKSYNVARTTLYSSIGPDPTNTIGVLKLLDVAGTNRTMAVTGIAMPLIGSVQAFAPDTSIGTKANCYIKGTVYAEGGFQYYNSGTSSWNTATSDARAKEIISPYSEGLSEIVKLNPIKFKFKPNLDPFPGDNERIGLIAQEVETVFPNCVFQTKQKLDGIEQDVYQLDTKDLTFVFINAFKELNEKYKSLEEKYNALVNRIENNK